MIYGYMPCLRCRVSVSRKEGREGDGDDGDDDDIELKSDGERHEE